MKTQAIEKFDVMDIEDLATVEGGAIINIGYQFARGFADGWISK